MINGTDLLNLMENRQSERKYLDKPVESEKIEKILHAGRIAPSACNGQPWKFIVVNDSEKLREVAAAASAKTLKMNTFVDQAPVLIVIIREKSNLSSRAGALVKDKDYSLIDIGIATASMAYMAAAEGLGTCIIGWLDEKKIRQTLSIPKTKRIELILSVGYTDNTLRTKVRKPPEDIISFNKY
jgi:nitroreductase